MHQAMVAGRDVQPSLENGYVVMLQAGDQFLKDLHHRVPAFLPVLQVFETNTKSQCGITVIEDADDPEITCLLIKRD